MRADRPLLAAAAFLAAGLWTIFFFGTANSAFSAAIPFSNSTVHLDVTTAGPAAIGGVVLTLIGLLLLVWAIIAAIAGQGGSVRDRVVRERVVDRYPAPVETAHYEAPATSTTGRKHFL
ncbi:MAG: hypothetical protein ACRD3N_06790 [Terracidiphilus sp.]